jgi:hypothetical protein
LQLDELLEEFAEVSLSGGRRAPVRNGSLPAREILITVRPVGAWFQPPQTR